MSSIQVSSSFTSILEGYGLPNDYSDKDIQGKIEIWERELKFLSDFRAKLEKQAQLAGGKIRKLKYENERMDLPIDSKRRLFHRVKTQLSAFISGSSLSGIKKSNQLLIDYLEVNYQSKIQNLQDVHNKYAEKKIRVRSLKDILGK
jgi:hypothetical protein